MRCVSSWAGIGILLLGFLAAVPPTTAQTARTNTLASLQTTFEAAAARLAADIERQRGDALVQYGKNLDALLMSLKQKGDIDGYAVADQETNRFKLDKTVLSNAVPTLVAPVVAAYQSQILVVEADSKRRMTALLTQYVAALDRLVKQLMLQDKIDDAKTAGDARRTAEGMLAKVQGGSASSTPPVTRVPPSSQPPVRSEASSRAATSIVETVVSEKTPDVAAPDSPQPPTANQVPPQPVAVATPTSHAMQFVVQCNGKNVTNALVVVYTAENCTRDHHIINSFHRRIVDFGVTGENGASLSVAESKAEFQIAAFAPGYRCFIDDPQQIKGGRITINLLPNANTAMAERCVFLPMGVGVPIFGGVDLPEIEAGGTAWNACASLKTVSPWIEWADGTRGSRSVPFHFDVYRKESGKKQRAATCSVLWYFKSPDESKAPSGILILVNEK